MCELNDLLHDFERNRTNDFLKFAKNNEKAANDSDVDKGASQKKTLKPQAKWLARKNEKKRKRRMCVTTARREKKNIRNDQP